MNPDKLKAANVLAKKYARKILKDKADYEDYAPGVIQHFIAGYEATPSESQAAGDWIKACAEELLTTMVDGDGPEELAANLRKTTCAIIAKHTSQQLVAGQTAENYDESVVHEEAVTGDHNLIPSKLVAAQARIAELEKERDQYPLYSVNKIKSLELRVAVLEKALDSIIEKCGEDYDERDPFDDIQRIALAAQPSREKEGP